MDTTRNPARRHQTALILSGSFLLLHWQAQIMLRRYAGRAAAAFPPSFLANDDALKLAGTERCPRKAASSKKRFL
jgi:hypothetical protein